jgi:hypothetical protein
MVDLPNVRTRAVHWQYAADLLMAAAASGKRANIDAATAKFPPYRNRSAARPADEPRRWWRQIHGRRDQFPRARPMRPSQGRPPDSFRWTGARSHRTILWQPTRPIAKGVYGVALLIFTAFWRTHNGCEKRALRPVADDDADGCARTLFRHDGARNHRVAVGRDAVHRHQFVALRA